MPAPASRHLFRILLGISLAISSLAVAPAPAGQSGRALAASLPPAGLVLSSAIPAAAADLDSGFGSAGKATVDFGFADENLHALALQSDGKIIAAGHISGTASASWDFALARLNTNGMLDTTFDTDGKVTTNLNASTNGNDSINAVAVQSDGKIVVAGQTQELIMGSPQFRWAIARYTASGALDGSFDTDGIVTLGFDTSADAAAKGLAIQSDGKILVAGYAVPPGDTHHRAIVVRLNINGSLDTTWGGDNNGVATAPFGGETYGNAQAIELQNGLPVIAGGAYYHPVSSASAARFTATGALDTTFGSSGRFTTTIGGIRDAADLAVTSDNKLVVAGYNGAGFAVARLQASGGLDPSFGSGGVVTTTFSTGAGYAFPNAAALTASGSPIVVGWDYNGTGGYSWAIARFTSGGVLDSSFGTGGKLTTAVSTDFHGANAVLVQTDGKILVGGAAAGTTGNDFTILRLTGDGAANPAPAASSLSPSSATAGGAAFTLTVSGSNFVSGAKVRWNGSDRTTTFVSSTQLQASIPASDLAAAGSASVTVFNPAPGGGTSGALTFTINPAAAVPSAGEITRISVSSDNVEPADSSEYPSISGDGRYVAFGSSASTLVAGDTNGELDVFVHDRSTRQTSRVNVSSSGEQANGHSSWWEISADGRYVAFNSWASNLVAGDTNGEGDVFVHDRNTGQTSRVSVSSTGAQGNATSTGASISGDGRYVAFSSWATNLVPGTGTGQEQVFVHDRQTGETTHVSRASDGMIADRTSTDATISKYGRYVAFSSLAGNLVPGDTNYQRIEGNIFSPNEEEKFTRIYGWDVFVHDRITGQTRRVSVASSGAQGESGNALSPSISDEGRYITFNSDFATLVSNDTNRSNDVFLHDISTGQTTFVCCNDASTTSRLSSGPSVISGDGSYIAFATEARMIAADDDYRRDIQLYNRSTGQITGVSVSPDAADSHSPSLSSDGRFVAFASEVKDLVSPDTNLTQDIFVYDRTGGATSWPYPSTPPPALTQASCTFSCTMDYLLGATDGRTCAATNALAVAVASLGIRPLAGSVPDRAALYRIRDNVLTTTPEGQRLVDLYYTHSADVVQTMIANPDLAVQAVTTLQTWTPALTALADGKTATITAEMVQQAKQVTDRLQQVGSPALQRAVQNELALRPLDSFVGQPIDQAAQSVLASQTTRVYLPVVINSTAGW